ncbi:MAG: sulfurtransferase TusA family protein [Haloquadratum sp.]|jgi:TusA-related sulfurtransferase|nr:sulfurtransferase TusA family protein [Haloferacaceae archaeon]MDR9445819.1 sulfurtransferase TusA family protein [Haloquadratum sp.]
MSQEHDAVELDATGLNCPMPVIQTSQAFADLGVGETLEVHATDPGSVSDIAGWADSTDGASLREQTEQDASEGTVYVHRIERVA